MRRSLLGAWSEDDEEMLEDVRFNFMYNRGEMTDAMIAQYNHFFDKIKYLKPQPKQEWTEEDEEMYKEVLTDIIYAKNNMEAKECLGLSKRAMKAFNWFSKRYKSLRPQNTWKPSDEQMVALEKECIAHSNYELCRLLEQLKKLREE